MLTVADTSLVRPNAIPSKTEWVLSATNKTTDIMLHSHKQPLLGFLDVINP